MKNPAAAGFFVTVTSPAPGDDRDATRPHGIDLSRTIRIEDGVEWAARNGVRYLDIQLDTAANAITSFDAKRVAAVRLLLENLNKEPADAEVPRRHAGRATCWWGMRGRRVSRWIEINQRQKGSR